MDPQLSLARVSWLIISPGERDLAIAHLARDCSLPDHKTICEMVCLSVGVLPNILEEQSIKFL